MTAHSPAAPAVGRWLANPVLPSAGDDAVELALRRRLGWAAAVGAAFATLVAVAGWAFGDRPTPFGAVALLSVVVIVAAVFRGLASRILARLDDAASERDALRARLDAAGRTTEELRGLAYQDELTGLPNRSLLYDRLGVAISHARRQATRLAILFVDLDDFKTVNDSFGHAFGDRLLVELAARFRRSVRAGDTVARFGGDEFIVLLNGVGGTADAAQVAAKVLEAARAPFRLDRHEVRIGATVGMSLYPEDGASGAELVHRADAAMYRDKRSGPRPDRDLPLGPAHLPLPREGSWIDVQREEGVE